MCANHAEIYKVAVKTNASDVGATSRNISPTARYTPRLSETVREQIATKWCGNCGTFTKKTANGLCARCEERLAKEWEARNGI